MAAQTDAYDIATDIWSRKYRYAGSKEIPADKSINDTMKRVAKACAVREEEPERYQRLFESILTTLEFIPGGRIVANAGTAREEVTMFNCYVMNKIDDSIEGIFDTVKNSALTQKQGGGVGFDFSTIRPRGANIQGCEAQASGPLSFMQVLDSTCRTIMSAGQRRGAQMGILRCDHPDIESFIEAKRKNQQLQMFNLSVAITEEFINAVKNDLDWELKFKGVTHKTVRARELWDKIMHSTYDYAEPGFILIDKINQLNNLYYCEEIRATNPCGEQPLPPYGACLLGSVNLTRFVKHPFSDKAEFDFERLREVVPIAVRLLDNVIDLSNYPLQEQRAEAYSKRRMGIGITGLADALLFLRVKYGSQESIRIAGEIMDEITRAAYAASVELAKEKGAFKKFNAAKYCAGAFVSKLPEALRADIRRYGIRNSHLTSIAPTGTISLLAGNVSSGLEPVFALKYTRRIRTGKDEDVYEVEIADYAYRAFCQMMGEQSIDLDKLPDYFVTADTITPEEHLEIQAELQKHVDSSISKTINIPADYPFDKFKDIYMKAYEKGLKGCTTFRPSEYISGVLIRDEDKDKKAKEEKTGTEAAPKQQLELTPGEPAFAPRPETLPGTTYKIKTPFSSEAFYITINDYQSENGKRRPYELFINTKNLQHFSWIVAMSRLISAVLRHESDSRFLVDELKSIYDPNGGYFQRGKYIPSLAAEIGYVLEQHISELAAMEAHSVVPHAAAPEPVRKPVAETQPAPAQKSARTGKEPHANSGKMFCPQCNERELVNQENCLKCLACGYSKCG